MPELHGKNGLFTADPIAFIESNACTLAGWGGTDKEFTGAFLRSPVGKDSVEYLVTPTTRMEARIYVEERPGLAFAPCIRVSPSSTGTRAWFLPYEENGGTAIEVDPAAELVLTGPLSGCHVYVGTKAGFPPLLMHMNSNATKDDRVANMAAKDHMAMKVASEKGYRVVGRLARGGYEIPAFVWGKKVGGNWKVFVHEIDLVAKRGTNREIPAL